MNKIKTLFIFIVTWGVVIFAFYNIYSNIKSEKDKAVSKEKVEIREEEKIVTEEETVSETEEIEEEKQLELEPDEKKIEEVKDEKIDEKDNIFSLRNIFKVKQPQIVEEEEEEEKEEVVEEKVKEEVNITDILKKINVNFTMESEYDTLALINNKKYRQGDFIDGIKERVEIINIKEDYIILRVNEKEVELNTGSEK
ncbi:MAG: hypothetical protein ACQESP_04085 [Candidatus Muiribacteriota bacterium]